MFLLVSLHLYVWLLMRIFSGYMNCLEFEWNIDSTDLFKNNSFRKLTHLKWCKRQYSALESIGISQTGPDFIRGIFNFSICLVLPLKYLLNIKDRVVYLGLLFWNGICFYGKEREKTPTKWYE